MDGVLFLVGLFVIGVPIVLLILFLTGKSELMSKLRELKAENKRILSILENLDKKVGSTDTLPETVVETKPEMVEPTPVVVSELVQPIIKAEVHEEKESVAEEIIEEIPPVQEEVVEEEPVLQETPVVTPTPIAPVKKSIDKPKKDFEKIFGINLLSKIGIATLVLGIAYFVKYAIDQNWINEIGRVAIGVLAGAALIFTAHKLRERYRTFSSILVGGGISTLYITIALAFWEYGLFSQSVAFALLIFITALSVFFSIAYDKKELAIFSLLGGFASPLMISTGTGNYIVLFSYLFILNTGMLILAMKKNWKIVNIIAFSLTLIFYWAWLFKSFEKQTLGASIFALLFFIQFHALAMIDYFKSAEREITVFQAIVLLSNSLSLFCAGLYIFDDFSRNFNGIITIVLAVLNAVPLWFVIKDKAVNKQMLYLLVAVVLSFVSLAVPIQLHGEAITMFWAVETVILLVLYRQSSINVFKVGYLVMQALALVALMMDWYKGYAEMDSQNFSVLITGLVVLATVWANERLIKKYAISFTRKGNEIWQTILKVTGVLLLFFILLFELRYRINEYYASRVLLREITGIYVYLFLAAYTFVCPKQKEWIRIFCGVLAVAVVGYVLVYLSAVSWVREETIDGTLATGGFFALHYLTIPALVLIFRYLIRNVESIKVNKAVMYWFITIISVIIVSAEADNLMLMCFSDSLPAYKTLSYSRTIAYPILWGIGAFILMFLGMKNKNRQLRIISLSLFALIIAKLYLYDIWQMSQTGRIIAFIFLGLLFLSVSFLYQKLKVLLQKNEEEKS